MIDDDLGRDGSAGARVVSVLVRRADREAGGGAHMSSRLAVAGGLLVFASGCALPDHRYWEVPADGRTAQDFERDHRICYADSHRVTLEIIGPAQVDRAYVDCLTALGWKPADAGSSSSACRSRYSEGRPDCRPAGVK
jgi:hypothetical protein